MPSLSDWLDGDQDVFNGTLDGDGYPYLVDDVDYPLAEYLNHLGHAIMDIQETLQANTLIHGMRLVHDADDGLTVEAGQCWAQNGDLIILDSDEVKTSLSLSNSTWYHVYIYMSGGSPAVEVVTTAPASWKGTAYSKNGSTGRRYLGSVKTDGSGDLIPWIHHKHANLMLYHDYQVTASPFLLLNAGTASSATAIAAAGIMPVTATIGLFTMINSGDQNVRFSEDSGVGSGQVTHVLSNGDSAVQRIQAPIMLDGSQQIYYAFAAGVGSGGATVYGHGYYYDR